jgi:hypothetical protein
MIQPVEQVLFRGQTVEDKKRIHSRKHSVRKIFINNLESM